MLYKKNYLITQDFDIDHDFFSIEIFLKFSKVTFQMNKISTSYIILIKKIITNLEISLFNW